MDWNAEDKQAAWAFYKERLEQYFIIAGTPHDTKVTHILFYGGKEASERWTALKDQVDQNKLDDSETVFKAFANSFEKSSSHWQARVESLRHQADLAPDHGWIRHLHQGPDKKVQIFPGGARVM